MPITNIIVLLKVHYSVMGSTVNPLARSWDTRWGGI